MAFDLYDLLTLDAVMRTQKTPSPPFWLTLFNRQINFDTPEIYFEKVQGDDRGLAPFVIPTMQGRPQKLDGYTAVALAPAYVKILDVVNPQMHISRMPGESFGGSLSISQRRDAVIAELLRKARVKFQNTNEWLASRAIIDGEVTISGEDYPATLVDFRRDATLTAVLAGAAKWDVSTGDPLATLKDLRLAANDLSGARISKHVFGANAWELFTQRVDLKELMNNQFGGRQVAVTLIADDYQGGQEYMGRIAGANGQGAIDVFVDTSKYISAEDGTTQYFLDQNTVVGVSQDVQGVRCYGAIMDAEAGYRPLEYFLKNWRQPNPSAEMLLSQSAPLMVPKNPNATFSVKVA
jgi:hypothetical protein